MLACDIRPCVKKFVVVVWKAKKFSPAESHQESSKIQKETSINLPTRIKFHFIITDLVFSTIFWAICLVKFCELMSQTSDACSVCGIKFSSSLFAV